MEDDELLRYSRQIMLPQIDLEGQQRLTAARVLVLGLGGLGSPVAMYLAAAGVGTLVLADDDEVELSNLQRQIVHGTPDLGRPKVESAAERLQALNPAVRIEALHGRMDEAALREIAGRVDAVVGASDNFPTRHALNRACVAAGTPLISGAAIRFEGQVAVFPNRDPGDACYGCLYPETPDTATTCSENGVLAPVVGVIGSLQAVETIKVLLDLGRPLAGRLLLWDALAMEWRTVGLRRDPACPACGSGRAAAPHEPADS